MILAYLSVQDRERNVKLKAEISNILETSKNNKIIILRDFDRHVDYIWKQYLNENGNIVLNLQEKHNLVVLKGDEKCEGTYTWSRHYGDQKSVKDYVQY